MADTDSIWAGLLTSSKNNPTMDRCLWHAQWGDFWFSSLTLGPKSLRSTADANISLSYPPFPALAPNEQAKTAISKRMLPLLPEHSLRYQRCKRAAPGRSPFATRSCCPYHGSWPPSDLVSICLNQHFQDIIFRKVRPPQQSLVFIPKADQGEYADNYRPLGLPNTCDRIIDRAAYSLFCQTLMNSLHPAQALLNLFREPQYNYLEVQDFLNCSHEERAVLLSDLAKAFERVNPHWIIHVLMCRGVSYWVLNYCRHILFGRRVLHKIHSTFRPPLAIHNGVDMGRAFSVLLFCIAMDPWYYHVHQIPRVLINRGYMDDNATGGSWS